MKRTFTLALLLFTFFAVTAQKRKLDTLRAKLANATTDTMRYNASRQLGNRYYISDPDSSIIFQQQAYLIAKKNNWLIAQANCFNGIANAYATMGDYATGIQFYIKALRGFEKINFLYGISEINDNIGATYIQKGDYEKALPYLQTGLKQFYESRKKNKLTQNQIAGLPVNQENLGECYLYLHHLDSAKYYLDASYKRANEINFSDVYGATERDLGEVELLKGNKAGAMQYLRRAFTSDRSIDDVENLSIAYLSMANLYHQYKVLDSAEYYAKKALDTAAAGKYVQDILNAGKALSQYYDEGNDLPNAYKYFKITTAAKDSIYSQDKVKQLLTLDFNEKERQQELQAEQDKAQDLLRTYILSGGLAVLLMVILIIWRNARQRQKANAVLAKTLSDLKSTQSQLVQSEKMASLGELTAGIAHEIQNPLNFVNNFSEVNAELIAEMQQEIEKGDLKEIKAIAGTIEENSNKISMHGKRAEGIVKGMLQHSKTGSSAKEPTDINALADEYMRLAYHGLRAKDKSFNAELVTRYEESLPKVNIVPQDIGRVLLNLFNNAFYAVKQKAKTAGDNYKPEVKVITTTENGHVVVRVSDNGTGISDAIKEKIMQPFFTTKPAGDGTGLGLSLTYDMVVKGHGGSIHVNSVEGDGAEFIIKLPFN